MREMTHEERRRFGDAVRQARLERFDSKLAAYRAAGINSQTWERIESGESVKERSLVAVIKMLWPAAGGDWRSVPGVGYQRWLTAHTDDDNPRVDDALGALEEVVMEALDRIVLLESEVSQMRAKTAHLDVPSFLRAASDPRTDETGPDGEDPASEEGDSV